VKVRWATSDKLSKRVALKIISKKKAPMDFQQKFLPRELDVMKMLDHPYIIKMYDILYINDKVNLIIIIIIIIIIVVTVIVVVVVVTSSS